MDTCQPIYISVKDEPTSNYFILIVEDEKLKIKGDKEPYYYGFNWGVSTTVKHFSTPEDTYRHAMKLFPTGKVIEKITSMHMNEFLSDNELEGNYK